MENSSPEKPKPNSTVFELKERLNGKMRGKEEEEDALMLDTSKGRQRFIEKIKKQKHLTSEDIKLLSTKISSGYIPLHYAARAGETDYIYILSAPKELLNAQDLLGNTPLHLATRCGHEETVKKLIKLGAQLTITNNDEQSVLDIALTYGHFNLAKLFFTEYYLKIIPEKILFKMVAEASSKYYKAYSKDTITAEKRNAGILNCLDWLYNILNIPFDITDSNGNTLMHYAVSEIDNFDLSKLIIIKLICFNLNLQSINKQGKTPEDIIMEQIKLVIKQLKDSAKKESVKNTPQAMFFEETTKENIRVDRKTQLDKIAIQIIIIEKFFKNLNKSTLLFKLAEQGLGQELIKFLLENVNGDQRTEMNKQDADGNTALHIAARYGHKDVLLKLITLSADTTILNSNRQSILDIALIHGHLDIAILLTSYIKLKPNSKILFDMVIEAVYPSELSTKEENKAKILNILNCFDWLHDNWKIAFNVEDDNNNTLLHYAAMRATNFDEFAEPVLKKLLSFGLDIHATNKDGKTPRE